MDQFANTILAKDWAGRYNYPNVKTYGDTLIRSNSPTVGTDQHTLRPHHAKDIKDAFKEIRKKNTNPRLLKKINRDYLLVMSGKLDTADMVKILGDYRNTVKPQPIRVERVREMLEAVVKPVAKFNKTTDA